MPHLLKRSAGYYYRQRIPHPLQPAFRGRRELTVSLRTKRLSEARTRVLVLIASAHDVFNQLKESMGKISHHQAQQIAENWRRRVLNDDFDRRIQTPVPTEPADYDSEISRRVAIMQEGRLEEDQQWTSDIMRHYGLNLDASNPDWRLMAFYLMKADIQQMQEKQKRDQAGQPHLMEYLPETPVKINDSAKDLRLSVMLQKWEDDTDRPARTVQQWRNAVRRFIELKGDLAVSRITSEDIKDFRDAYKRMPRTLSAKDKIRTLPEITAKYPSPPEVLHPRTVNNTLGMLSAIFGWCCKEQFIKTNPASGIRVPMPKVDTARRLPFTQTELKQIFEHSPVYRDGKRYASGGGEASYWIPLIAFYTGARMEEIGNLYSKDIVREGDLVYMDIYADKSKRVKNQASVRKVPLHRDLLALGLLEYAEKTKARKHQWLFPLLKPFSGRRTHYFSKWVNPYLRNHCGISDTRKVFHCFRHTFKDICRNALMPEEINDALTGHTRDGVGAQYGQGHSLRVLNEAIQKVEFLETHMRNT